MFDNFLKNRNSAELIGPALTLTNIKKNWKTRAVMYVLSLIFILGALQRSKKHVEHPEDRSQWGDAFWATFGCAGVGLACAFLTLIMLVGQLSWLRSILAADMW